MTDTVSWIWFQLVFGIGTRRAELLLNYFSHPREIWQGVAAGNGVVGMLLPAELDLVDPAAEHAGELLRRTQRKGCQVVTPDDPVYPQRLRSIYSRPAALYVKGDLSCLQDTLTIAMVGTRKHTQYGAQAAEYIAKGLAEAGVVVVSGLAPGIDTQSHTSALEAGGKTIGVLGCGLDIAYPKGSSQLKTAMSRQGAVLTEYPLGEEPLSWHFPVRNRIISGICHGTVVVEADKKSGAMITANLATEQGRDVFAVPGSIFSIREQGTHQLIREGAKLVDCAHDILDEYTHLHFSDTVLPQPQAFARQVAAVQTHSPQTKKQPLPPQIGPVGQAVYEQMQNQPIGVEELAVNTNLDMGEILSTLTELEIYGLIQGYAGRKFGLK